MYIYEWRQLLWYFVVSVLACAVCFVLTCMFGIPKEVLEQDSGDCSADCNASVSERGWEEGHGGRSEEKESVGFDMEKIKEAGYEVITPVIVSNTEEYWRVEGREVGNVKCMEDLIKVLG